LLHFGLLHLVLAPFFAWWVRGVHHSITEVIQIPSRPHGFPVCSQASTTEKACIRIGNSTLGLVLESGILMVLTQWIFFTRQETCNFKWSTQQHHNHPCHALLHINLMLVICGDVVSKEVSMPKPQQSEVASSVHVRALSVEEALLPWQQFLPSRAFVHY